MSVRLQTLNDVSTFQLIEMSCRLYSGMMKAGRWVAACDVGDGSDNRTWPEEFVTVWLLFVYQRLKTIALHEYYKKGESIGVLNAKNVECS